MLAMVRRILSISAEMFFFAPRANAAPTPKAALSIQVGLDHLDLEVCAVPAVATNRH